MKDFTEKVITLVEKGSDRGALRECFVCCKQDWIVGQLLWSVAEQKWHHNPVNSLVVGNLIPIGIKF